MNIKIRFDYTIIKRHWIVIFAKLIKAFFFLFIALIFYYGAITYYDILGQEFVLYIILPIIWIILNYSFIKIFETFLQYYNEVLIIHGDQIIIIRSSLFLMDDIEIIDSYRVMKFDSYADGFWANLLGYGHIVLEQQKDNVRIFHFVPQPYRVISILKEQRDKILNDRRKKYIVNQSSDIVDEVKNVVKNIRNY
ncbi:MAG: hypothetical protein PHR68_01900 [Candidatus Gracilibacteria bacterium]|nr:hypothetical protein [Candidatus Gracilibacteria bacterium]